MTGIRRLTLGEVLDGIPGSTWNRFADATDFVERQRKRRPGGTGSLSASSRAMSFAARNSTGAALPRYGIVGIGDVILSPADDAAASDDFPRMEWVAVTDVHKTRFAVVQAACGNNEDEVLGVYRGITWAKVNVVTAGDSTCGIIDGDKTKLLSGKPGAKILWAEKQDDVGAETGEQWAVVEITESATIESGTGALSGESLPAGVWNRTGEEFTPGTAVLAVVTPWVVEDPEATTLILVAEKDELDAAITLPALNYTQGEVHLAVPQKQVFGFRTFIGGVEYFAVTGTLRNSCIHGKAVGAVTAGMLTFSVDTIEIVSGAGPTNANGTAATTLTVNNTFGFAIDNLGAVRCVQRDDGDWECVQAECPA